MTAPSAAIYLGSEDYLVALNLRNRIESLEDLISCLNNQNMIRILRQNLSQAQLDNEAWWRRFERKYNVCASEDSYWHFDPMDWSVRLVPKTG